MAPAIPQQSERNLFLQLFCSLIGCCALLSPMACTWVNVTPEAEQVAIVPAGRVQDCRKAGTTTTSVKASVVGISRNRDKVLSELDALAQLEAVNIGANTLVREIERENSATYSAYTCP